MITRKEAAQKVRASDKFIQDQIERGAMIQRHLDSIARQIEIAADKGYHSIRLEVPSSIVEVVIIELRGKNFCIGKEFDQVELTTIKIHWGFEV